MRLAFFVFLMIMVRVCIEGVIHPEFAKTAPFLEATTFFTVLFLILKQAFQYNGLEAGRVQKSTVIVLFVYLYVPMLEFIFPFGNRSIHYPPNNHFILNWVSFYMATGDMGTWQIIRIFSCSLTMGVLLRMGSVTLKWILVTNFLVYTLFSIYAHAGLWQFAPDPTNADSVFVSTYSLPALIPVCYNLLLISGVLFLQLYWRNKAHFSNRMSQLILWIIIFFISANFFSLFATKHDGFTPFILFLLAIVIRVVFSLAVSIPNSSGFHRILVLYMLFIATFAGTSCNLFFFVLILTIWVDVRIEKVTKYAGYITALFSGVTIALMVHYQTTWVYFCE